MVDDEKKIIAESLPEFQDISLIERIDNNDIQLNNLRLVNNSNGIVCHSIGKNILNYIDNLKTNYNGLVSVINDDGSITTTGKPTSGYTTIIEYNINDFLEDGETYTLWQETSEAHILYLQLNAIHKNTQQISYYSLYDGTVKRTFTVNKTNYDYILNLQTEWPSSWGDDIKTITNKYQIEKGNAITSFEPYEGCLYGLELYDMIEPNFITSNYYLNCGIIALFLALIIILVNAPFLFIRKIKGD